MAPPTPTLLPEPAVFPSNVESDTVSERMFWIAPPRANGALPALFRENTQLVTVNVPKFWMAPPPGVPRLGIPADAMLSEKARLESVALPRTAKTPDEDPLNVMRPPPSMLVFFLIVV